MNSEQYIAGAILISGEQVLGCLKTGFEFVE